MESDLFKAAPGVFSVSIVLNLYNAEKNIGRFLDSLRIFVGQKFELVIVDDGSTDATLEIVRQYAEIYTMRLEALPHQGLVPARAHGVQVASGDVIIVLDDDEIIDDPDLIRKFLQPFTDPQVGAVGGNKWPVGSGWLIAAQCLDRQFRQWMRKSGKNNRAKYVMGGVFAVRKTALVDIGGMTTDPRIVEDTDLSIRLRQHGWVILSRDDIVVGHPDPDTLAGVFKKAVRQGVRVVHIGRTHPREILSLRFALLYAPLWILLTAILSWKLTLGLVLASFVLFMIVYSRLPSTWPQRLAAWLLLYINGIGVTWGTILGLLGK